jgi:hypothetical protein
MGDEYSKEVEERVFSLSRGDGRGSGFDFDEIRRMNSPKAFGPGAKNHSKNVFDIDTLDQIEKIRSKFFKS